MTLQVDPGPGVSTYTSTLFQCTVGGLAQHTWGKSRTVPFGGQFWSDNQMVEVSQTRFGSDTVQIVRVSLTAAGVSALGVLTSAVVYPQWIYADRVEIQGTTLVISMPPNGKAVVEVNGVRGTRLHISADPLDAGYANDDINTIIYNGTQVEAPEGKTLVFPPGVSNLTTGAWGDKLFPIRDGATVVLTRGAWVIGNLDLRRPGNASTASNITIRGGGNLSGEFTTWEDVIALPGGFAEQWPYTMIFADTPVSGTNNVIQGVAIWQTPLYALAFVNVARDVAVLTPWTPNTDGINLSRDDVVGPYTIVVERCILWCGDDGVHIHNYQGNATIRDNVLCTTAGATLLFGYQDRLIDLGFETTVTNNTVIVQQQYNDLDDGREWGNVIQAWVDSPEGFTDHGRFRVTIDGLYIEGATDDSCFLNIGPRFYPWGTPGAANGRVAQFTFRNISIETPPPVKSRIRATDWKNTTHEIEFWNLRIGGVQVTTANWFDYFSHEGDEAAFLYRIFIGGRALTTAVDICNSALSYVGERDRVTSITPVDGSEEARHAARAYTEAFEELLELHSWSFALKKAQLTVINENSEDSDDPAWAYRYELPDDLNEALAVLPDDAPEDYVLHGTGVPRNFHIKLSEADGIARLYTNEADAWLRYTVYVTDPGVCSRLFIAALTWLTAAKLAGSVVRGDAGEAMRNRCLAMFGKYLSEAKTKDARQRQVDAKTTPMWMRGRTEPDACHPFRNNA